MKFKLNCKIKKLDEISEPSKRKTIWKQIGFIYLSYVRRRYVDQSKGGGEWEPLKSKRKRNKSGKQLILRDTGFLLQSLSLGTPGNFFDARTNSVTVGFANVPHSDDTANLREIAIFHNEGKGNLPQREILVAPDGDTDVRMIKQLRKLFNGK